MKQDLNYDLVIMGGGPAGLSAGIYAARGAVKTAIIDTNMTGGQVSNTLELENYPGFPIIGGFDLMEKFEEHADKFGVKKHIMQEIQSINLKNDVKIIETAELFVKTKSVILATGAKPQKLGIPGEEKFAGRGVSYCAVCDGAFFRDKIVTVVGGGNAAVEEALYLTKFASKVNIVHRRSELRADKIIQERAFNNNKINFIWDSVAVEIKGENNVQTFIIKNVKTNELTEIQTDGVFPYIGFNPNTEMFANDIKLDSKGFIEANMNLETNLKGVFVAGDVRVTPLRQVITAAADGAVSATNAIKYIEELEIATV
ncbi:MAG: thioredoxin-disulfide reductase [Candidatus Gastranaerophilales bacterium]|nr:thioredoxin-disulfide reductase [Candidatus Gastranaerophilales bacterium]